MERCEKENYKVFIRLIIKINKKINLKSIQAIQEKIQRLYIIG
jgi:16S rRNA G527 N7-methylase RsmG